MNPVLELRQKADLTQALLSDLTGVNRSTTSKYENGHSSPRVETLERLASAVDLVVAVTFQPAPTSEVQAGSEGEVEA